MSTENPGVCTFCEQSYSSRGMTRHLQACKARKEQHIREGKDDRKSELHHLRIVGKYYPEYWMHLELDGERSLTDLDTFLRAIWLECCGHMSEFKSETTDYMPDEYIEMREPVMPGFGSYQRQAASMDIPLNKVFETEDALEYEYDFGSTTHLRIEMKDARAGVAPEKGLRIMARNTPPEFPCTGCGEKAAVICVECQWITENPFYCDSCAKDVDRHACDYGYDMTLPVVNSPRMGVCGYSGPYSPESDGWRIV